MSTRKCISTLAFGLLLFCQGCIGQKQALKTQGQVMVSSEKAVAVIEQLKDASIKQTAAYLETRSNLTQMVEELKMNRTSTARLSIAVLAAQAKTEVLQEANRQRLDWQQSRWAALVKLNDEWTRAEGLLKSTVDKELKNVTAARDEAEKHKDDLKFELTAVKADREYIALVARFNYKEATNRIEFAKAWDAAEEVFSKKIQAVVNSHFQKITAEAAKLEPYLNEMAKLQASLGDAPVDNAAAYDKLQAYAQAVQEAAEAMEDYLESNSLDKNSFFRGALKAFGKGLLNAVPIIGTGKGASLEEVKNSGKEVMNVIQGEIKTQLNSAKESAKVELKSASTLLRAQAESATKSLIDKFLPEKATITAGK